MIREANITDIVRLAEIHVYGWRIAYKDMIPDSELFIKVNVDRSLNIFKNILSNNNENILLFEDNKIIKGFVIYNSLFEVKALYVEPQFKREKVGSTLLKSVELYAKKESCKEVSLWVLESNTPSINFYNNQGYKKSGETKYIESWELKELGMTKALISN